ncbi:uncharacterized protein LOC124722415 [Schistocerca piceifrons]|uniref:uncharacterized protein LOC124722415 n=1 Tax=Schistocerca piceifrons TaxID=274613 RepID=UPI001F5E6B2B|nr:uncharacterized protein LOC124722415 [Schistocerca piceifrons]
MSCVTGDANEEEETRRSPALELWRLEQRVRTAEAAGPAAALGQAVSRRGAVRQRLAAVAARHNALPDAEPSAGAGAESAIDATDAAARDAVHQLRLHRAPQRAVEHEEFIANMNRQALIRYEMEILMKKEAEAEEEIKNLAEKVNELQELYKAQDELLGSLFGESHGSEEEEAAEEQLEQARSYRDTLAGAHLEWRDAAALAADAVLSLENATRAWLELDSQPEDNRFTLAVSARNSLLEAVVYVSLAQALLPGVQFPYCTPRDLLTVSQALVYMLTDMQIPERYDYASEVFNNFLDRTKQFAKWTQQTMDDTLKRDLDDVEKKVEETAARLRSIRMDLIRKKFGQSSDPYESEDISRVINGEAPLFVTMEGGSAARRRLTHSALFSQSAAEAPQLYGPALGDFRDKLALRRRDWSSKKLEQAHMAHWANK